MKGTNMNEALYEYLTEVSTEYQDEYNRLMELIELEELL
jgi:hypothetical protein